MSLSPSFTKLHYIVPLAPSASFTLLRKTQPRSTTATGPHLTTTMTPGSYVVNRSKPRYVSDRTYTRSLSCRHTYV